MARNAYRSPHARFFWIALGGVLLASRLAHQSVLWADEDYHLAEAIQVLHGKVLYRDVWYDKPPLSALLFTLMGAWPGWPLRLLSAILAMLNCIVAFRFVTQLRTSTDLDTSRTPLEGYFAAGLLGFYQVFYIASATIPLEPDTLMILPHLLAVYWAYRGRAFAAGLAAGVAFLLNIKGVFVLAAAFLFCPVGLAGWTGLAAGFALPIAFVGGWLGLEGAFPAYIEQVWRWGFLYAGAPPNESLWSPLGRLTNWLAFHAALVIGTVYSRHWMRSDVRWKYVIWTAVSLAGACVGWRISPHYLNQLLPPLGIGGALGFAFLWRKTLQADGSSRGIGSIAIARAAAGVILITLLIPALRFGPRYAILAAEDVAGAKHTWSDVQMDQDSQRASELVRRVAKPGDTVFIWGYRPNMVVYTRLAVASRYWDSQAVTGVAADRHLGDATPLDAEWAARNRAELIRTHPDILVDGLSAYNPRLDIHQFADLADWLGQYCRIASTGEGITIYRRCSP